MLEQTDKMRLKGRKPKILLMDLTRVIDVIYVGYIANIMQCDRKLITSCGCKLALELFLVVLKSLDTTQDYYWYSDIVHIYGSLHD